jgi:ATP-dependent Clp protease ATP-binding subunit ClpX
MENVEIEFRPQALKAVAQKAMERKTGARGLRSILESVLLPTMYELPDQANAVKVVVNEQCITGESEPLVVLDIAELQHAASDE